MIVPYVAYSPNCGACAGENSENGAGNVFRTHYRECSPAQIFVSVV